VFEGRLLMKTVCFLSAAILALSISTASADSTVANLPAASTPYTGAETYYCVQGGVDSKCLTLGANWSVTDPQTGSSNDRTALSWSVTTSNTSTNSSYSDENALQLGFTTTNGQYVYGGGTNAKKTNIGLNLTGTYYGGGQHFNLDLTASCIAVGDCAPLGMSETYAAGPIAGDEGYGFTDVALLTQQASLSLSTISSVPTQTTCNTTLTQSIVGGYVAQTVTVASSTDCNPGDWVVINQQLPTNTPNEEAVYLTATAAGSITGVFTGNYANGTTVTPATILNASGQWGQGRWVIDETAASYSIGTAYVASGFAITGVGTSWANNMVGGNAANIGCIAFSDDTYRGSPFNGSGSNGPLQSWFPLDGGVNSASMGGFSTSTAGDAAYHGTQTTAAAYIIRPCAKILYRTNSQIILETTSYPWTAGDALEQAITPFPDVTGFQYHFAAYTNGGAYRAFMQATNTGAREFGFGLVLNGTMPTGSDPFAWGGAIFIDGANTAIQIGVHSQHGFLLPMVAVGGTYNADICWGNQNPTYNPCIEPDSSGELFIQMTSGGSGGRLTSTNGAGSAYGTVAWTGFFAIGNSNHLATFDATALGAGETITVPAQTGTLMIGGAIASATVAGNFSAAKRIPIVASDGATYYVPAESSAW
jgi:hypothetical protein